MSQDQEVECPICMEPIEDSCNKTVTQCGHCFHSSCIFQNMAAHNGFGCPYCRTILAEEIESDDESEYSNDDDVEFSEYRLEFEQQREDYILTSFRMFHRLINNEEGNEVEEDNRYVQYVTDEAENATAEEREKEHKLSFISEYMSNKGITYNDLIKYIISLDDNRYESETSIVESRFNTAVLSYEAEL